MLPKSDVFASMLISLVVLKKKRKFHKISAIFEIPCTGEFRYPEPLNLSYFEGIKGGKGEAPPSNPSTLL